MFCCVVLKFNIPFEPALATLYGVPYTVTGNGSVTLVIQSSQWLPMSLVPGIIVAPVLGKRSYVVPMQEGGVGLAVPAGVLVGVLDGGIGAHGLTVNVYVEQPISVPIS